MTNLWNGLLSLALVVGLCVPAAAEQVTWKMGLVPATGSSYEKALKALPERIAKATQDRIKIELYPTLIPGPQQPAALRDGRLDVIAGVNPWLSGEAPILNIGHLPGLIPDVPEYKKLLDGYLAEEFARVWDKKYNGKLLASGVFEKQVILSNKPLRKVEDFRGLKVRVHNTEAAQLMGALGAKPTPIAFPEIATSLQRGIVDVVMTSVGTSYGFGFYTVAKYVNIWKIGTSVGWSLVVNNDTWRKLPPDLQKAVAEEMKRVENDHFADHEPYSASMLQKHVEKGMTVVEAPQSEIDKVFSPANVKAVYDAWYELNEKNGMDGKRIEARVREILARK